MRATSVDAAAAAEYDALFQGVGKPEVFLYGSFYLSGFLNERPLAALTSWPRSAWRATRRAARPKTTSPPSAR